MKKYLPLILCIGLFLFGGVAIAQDESPRFTATCEDLGLNTSVSTDADSDTLLFDSESSFYLRMMPLPAEEGSLYRVKFSDTHTIAAVITVTEDSELIQTFSDAGLVDPFSYGLAATDELVSTEFCFNLEEIGGYDAPTVTKTGVLGQDTVQAPDKSAPVSTPVVIVSEPDVEGDATAPRIAPRVAPTPTLEPEPSDEG